MEDNITINSPARIHLGFMELNDKAERLYGSLGLGINNFKNKQKIEKSKKFEVKCEDADIRLKVAQATKTFSSLFKIKKCKFTVSEFIPLHKGLGSGTQISLSTGYLISKFNNLSLPVNEISKILKRGQRSGIGVEIFKSGGFVVDIGKKPESQKPPIKLLNLEWPKKWKIILLTDNSFSGLHGKEETGFFSKLNNIQTKFANESCHSLMMKIIPGIIENDFSTFARGIKLVQENMSSIFYGNRKKFSSPKITKIFSFLERDRFYGYGQSSWGPTCFIFCENSAKRDYLFNKIENYIELKKIEGINLLKTEGRNYGNIIKKEN